ncbi:MAG: DUF3089 domain-containing protein [Pseudomonadales bacterium]|nr:DUF3089 domain-containing protein [Pseudomonadales bacterium]
MKQTIPLKRTFLVIAFILICTGISAKIFSAKIIDYISTPQQTFDASQAPAVPDYSQPQFWSAHPEYEDRADILPQGVQSINAQDFADIDVFYIHPTTYFLNQWNASADNWLANKINQRSVLPVQAGVFNGVAKIYAPNYRQASLSVQTKMDPKQKQQALALAYGDVERAFDYYMQHYNNGRGFIIAGHSQGAVHGKTLLQHLHKQYPEQKNKLLAAYLVGSNIIASELNGIYPICSNAYQVGCYLSWNTMIEGGDSSLWTAEGEPVCVNPLSWEHNNEAVSADYNLGAIPLANPDTIEKPDTGLISARCDKGMLWISAPDKPGYDKYLFEGGSYHAYDYNLFYMNIRENAKIRLAAYYAKFPL